MEKKTEAKSQADVEGAKNGVQTMDTDTIAPQVLDFSNMKPLAQEINEKLAMNGAWAKPIN